VQHVTGLNGRSMSGEERGRSAGGRCEDDSVRHRWIAGMGFRYGDWLRKPCFGRRQRRCTIGRAGEQENAVLRVISATTGGVVVGMAARLIAATMIPDRIQHGETDTHPCEEQDGEKAKQSGRQDEPVSHGEHYHWYGAVKSMFPRQVDPAIEPR
jgi:hypothetical protein